MNEQASKVSIKRSCPFCKHHQVQLRPVVDGEEDNDYYAVRCLNCGARGPLAVNELTAAGRWNNEVERHSYKPDLETGKKAQCVCGNTMFRR